MRRRRRGKNELKNKKRKKGEHIAPLTHLTSKRQKVEVEKVHKGGGSEG